MSDLSTFILAWDKRQSADSPTAKVCKVNKNHGRLTMHGSGGALICGAKDCKYGEPVSKGEAA